MELDNATRRRISQRAAQYLQDEEAYWTQRYWLCDLDRMDEGSSAGVEPDKDTVYAIGSGATMGRVREWLREHGFGARNRRCGVCAEGALLLSMAFDPTVPDEAVGEVLLRNFEADAQQAASDLDLIPDDETWSTIIDFNDDRADGEDDVRMLLNAMGSI